MRIAACVRHHLTSPHALVRRFPGWLHAGFTGLISSLTPVTAALLLVSGAFGAEGGSAPDKSSRNSEGENARSGGIFRLSSTGNDLVIVAWDQEAIREATRRRKRFNVSNFPLLSDAAVDLVIEPFSVTGANTRFLLGRRGQPDQTLDFDPSRISLFRGTVAGHSGSHVFLALAATFSTGYIDFGAGGKRYQISSTGSERRELDARRISIFEASGPASLPPGIPLCGVEHEERGNDLSTQQGDTTALSIGSIRGLKQLELAVDTDHEYFSLFGDADAAAAYLVALYAQVSDIYIRDLGMRVELVFARLWDTPNDLFNSSVPLNELFLHWDTHMRDVQRDAVQLLSGRRDYPFGGAAVVDALCGSAAYSVVGYALGLFPDPSMPSPYHYDIAVTAHELGHNSGTGHTHESPNFIDACDDPFAAPQRGTIMSYCAQTWSGGNSNQELYFHTRIRQNIEAFVDGARCIADDCNMNGIADKLDLQRNTSPDNDRNGIPDECEDCNANFVLDGIDISTGTSLDLNGNTIPDDCEPDCNGNLIPDAMDITDGGSVDLHGNGIPDECEVDCNSNDVSDYSEIQADMSLDVDRNGVLDSCQDCDADGTPDLEALGGSHNIRIASGLNDSQVGEFYASTGVLTALSSDGVAALVTQGQDLIVAPNGRVLVTSGGDNRVMELDSAGNYLRDLVPSLAGGLNFPTGLTVTPDGTLLVASRDTDSVLAYDVNDGSPLGAFIAPGSGGLISPFGLAFGPNGSLFVTSGNNQVLEFDGRNGSFVRVFVSAFDNAGLDQPRGLAFRPDGNLLVSSFGTNEVLEFRHQTGAPLGPWARVGTDTVLTQVSPWGIRVGPNGNVFVSRTGETFGSLSLESSIPLDGHGREDPSLGWGRPGSHQDGIQALHLTNAQIYEFDVRNGNFLRMHVGGNDHGFLFPTGFDFAPGWMLDCNMNLLPDRCDVALGHSEDLDRSGVPDECEIDCNGNGTLDRLDIIPYGASFDCNNNLFPDECDINEGISEDCSGNNIPDECEPDCNGNQVPDSCDLITGSSIDCNANGIPDECDVTDDLEIGLGWMVGAADDSATGGIWERVEPIGSVAQPEVDHTPRPGTMCFVTGQGGLFLEAEDSDIDGGRTTLFSPVFDLTGYFEARIGYWRWFSNDTGKNPGQDVFEIDISNDSGQTWTNVETVGPTGVEASGGWFFHRFRVLDFVEPTTAIALRFVAADEGGRSIVEAAIDDLVIFSDCLACQLNPDCDDGLTCTTDVCNEMFDHCDNTIDPGSCLIVGDCYGGGDLNPVDNCDLCDPSSATNWSSSVPVEVAGLVLEDADVTRLIWTDQGNGSVYDVSGHFLSSLRSTENVNDAECLADDQASHSWDDTRVAPPLGDGYYYLVRSQKDCGAGTYGLATSGAERQPESACP